MTNKIDSIKIIINNYVEIRIESNDNWDILI